MLNLLVPFGIVLATPLVRRFAVAQGIVDRPDAVRKLHAFPIAYLGGISIFAAIVARPEVDHAIGETAGREGLQGLADQGRLAHAAHAKLEGKLQGGQDAGQETVAEFTAAVLMHLYGLGDRTGNCWKYIQYYASDPLQAIVKARELDLVLIENVGNLVCPTGFALGEHVNMMIANVPEGDDKPYKYPVMYRGVDALVLNKTDLVDDDTLAEAVARMKTHLAPMK